MNKTEMKETFSKLSEVQQKVLIKALRKISINAFNYFCRSHDIKNLDPNDANWKYDGFIYSFDKRIDINGKKLTRFHCAKNILTNEEIKFSINDYLKIFSNKQNKSLEYSKIKNILNYTERMIFNQLQNMMLKFESYYYDPTGFINQLLETSDKIKELKNYEVIVNLLYYDLPLSDTLISNLNSFYINYRKRKEFDECLEQHENYENALVLSELYSLDEWIKIKYPKISLKYDNIINYYNKHKYLSEKQLQALEHIISMDFNKINKMINYLNEKKSNIKSNDRSKFYTIKSIMTSHGLKQDRLEELEQLFTKYGGKFED